jgi:chromosome segregation ATPase
MFGYKPAKFDTKPYEQKIDSLEHNIDSIKLVNDTLESDIQVLDQDNEHLSDKVFTLNNKVADLKGDLKDAQAALKYKPTQVDSFFKANYVKEYQIHSKDTTHLPLEVSKAAVVDIQEGKINKNIVLAQDSVIAYMDSSLVNRNGVIAKLREKEHNYINIDKDRVNQLDNYKIQVDGLKTEINKQNRKLKFGRIQKVVLGGLVLGLLIAK